MAITIDAFGLSCPQPIILVDNAIKKNLFPITVLTDSSVVVENISRFVKRKGFRLSKNYGDEVVSLIIDN